MLKFGKSELTFVCCVAGLKRVGCLKNKMIFKESRLG